MLFMAPLLLHPLRIDYYIALDFTNPIGRKQVKLFTICFFMGRFFKGSSSFALGTCYMNKTEASRIYN